MHIKVHDRLIVHSSLASQCSCNLDAVLQQTGEVSTTEVSINEVSTNEVTTNEVSTIEHYWSDVSTNEVN